MKVEPLTKVQHEALAIELYSVRLMLVELSVALSRRYGKTKRPGKKATNALRHLDQLRSEMDNQLAKDYPRDHRSQIYYRGGSMP